MKERDRTSIQADAEDVKNTVLRLSRRKALFPHVFTARGVDREWRKIDEFKTSKDDCGWFESFSRLIDDCVTDDHVTAIRVVARNNHNTVEVDKCVEKFINDVPVALENSEKAKNTSMDGGMNSFARQFLGLCGVPTDNLAAGDAHEMLFGAALCLNRRNLEREFNDKVSAIERRHEVDEYNRKLGEAGEKARQQEARISELECEKSKLEKELDKAYDQIDKATEELRLRESLRPENSVMGVSLAGLGSMIAQNVIRANAGVIGRLMGMPDGQLAGMLDAQAGRQETPAGTAPPSAPEVQLEEDVTEDGRTADIATAVAALRSLGDEDFSKAVAGIVSFARQRAKADGTETEGGA